MNCLLFSPTHFCFKNSRCLGVAAQCKCVVPYTECPTGDILRCVANVNLEQVRDIVTLLTWLPSYKVPHFRIKGTTLRFFCNLLQRKLILFYLNLLKKHCWSVWFGNHVHFSIDASIIFCVQASIRLCAHVSFSNHAGIRWHIDSYIGFSCEYCR